MLELPSLFFLGFGLYFISPTFLLSILRWQASKDPNFMKKTFQSSFLSDFLSPSRKKVLKDPTFFTFSKKNPAYTVITDIGKGLF